MIALKSDGGLKLTFERLIEMMEVPVEWNGLFLAIGNYLILQGSVRSLFFNFDTRKVVTNILDLPVEEKDIVSVREHPQVKDVLNMVLYAFGKWGTVKGLAVGQGDEQLNRLFAQILGEFQVESQYNSENFRFYKNKIRITYEDVLEEALKDEDAVELIPEEEEESGGLWHKLIWKKAACGFLMKDTTIAERRKNRIGNNFYLVGYLCPKCGNKMYMAVYPEGSEFLIETGEGGVRMARAYTCTLCCALYTPRPGRLLVDGDVYLMDFERDKKAYEDYLELLGKNAKKTVNSKFNEFADGRKADEGAEQKDEKEQIDDIVERLPDMSDEELFYTMRKMEEGFFSDRGVVRLERAIHRMRADEGVGTEEDMADGDFADTDFADETERESMEAGMGAVDGAGAGESKARGATERDGARGNAEAESESRADAGSGAGTARESTRDARRRGSGSDTDGTDAGDVKTRGGEKTVNGAGETKARGGRKTTDDADAYGADGGASHEVKSGFKPEHDGRDARGAARRGNTEAESESRAEAGSGAGAARESTRDAKAHGNGKDTDGAGAYGEDGGASHEVKSGFKPEHDGRDARGSGKDTDGADAGDVKARGGERAVDGAGETKARGNRKTTDGADVYGADGGALHEVKSGFKPEHDRRDARGAAERESAEAGAGAQAKERESTPRGAARRGNTEAESESRTERSARGHGGDVRTRGGERAVDGAGGTKARGSGRKAADGAGEYGAYGGASREGKSGPGAERSAQARARDEKKIRAICGDIGAMDFEDAKEALKALEKGDFLPDLKFDAVKEIEKRMQKIKTDECELLVGKLQAQMDGVKLARSDRMYFYPAKRILLKQAEPEETEVIDYALATYAAGIGKFEYPVLVMDKSRNRSGKEGLILTPENIYYSNWLTSYSIPIMSVAKIEASDGLLNRGVYVREKSGTKTKLPAAVSASEYGKFAKVLDEFVRYLQEKPFSRKEAYLAKEKHETICCYRCGYIYRGGGVCPRCGYKENG